MIRTRPTTFISRRTSGIDPRDTTLWEPVSSAVRDALDDVPDLPRTQVDHLTHRITDAAIDRAVLTGAVTLARPSPHAGRRITDAEVDAETADLFLDGVTDGADPEEDETR